ncbi:rhodanese-like domain-containing protein [Anaerosporobacter sp.]
MTTNQYKIPYEQISAKDAKEIMDNQEGYAILDVRTKAEYEASHIEDAILIPHEEINEEVTDILPDKNQQLLVYCRSGVRSKIAALQLARLGYTNIKEFGGIIEWPYDVVREFE